MGTPVVHYLICCSVTNYPNILQLETRTFYYLIVSESSFGSGSVKRLQSNCWLWLQSFQVSSQGASTFEHTYNVAQ